MYVIYCKAWSLPAFDFFMSSFVHLFEEGHACLDEVYFLEFFDSV